MRASRVTKVRHGGREHAMNNERRGRGEWKNFGVSTEETDDGCGGGGDRANSEAVCCQVVSDGCFEIRAVDEDEGCVVRNVEIDHCRSKSLIVDAAA